MGDEPSRTPCFPTLPLDICGLLNASGCEPGCQFSLREHFYTAVESHLRNKRWEDDNGSAGNL